MQKKHLSMSDRQTSCRLIRTDSGRVGAETRARLSRACGHKSTQRLGCWVSLDPAPFRPRRLILGFHGSNRSNIQNGTDETRKAPGWPGSSTLTFCSFLWVQLLLAPVPAGPLSPPLTFLRLVPLRFALVLEAHGALVHFVRLNAKLSPETFGVICREKSLFSSHIN